MEKGIEILICIFSYNNESYILESIESVLCQKTKYRIVLQVYDDCSTDLTISKIVSKYGNSITIHQNQKNEGFCSNLYRVMKSCKEDYFYALAGDDYFASNEVVDQLVDVLEKNKNYMSASGWNYVVDKNGNAFSEHKNINKEFSIEEYMIGKKPLCIDGMYRNFWKNTKEDFSYMVQGAKNNEEIFSWTFTLEKGKKIILQRYIYNYRCIKEENGTNYNSQNTVFSCFMDNYKNIILMQKKRSYCYKGLVVQLVYRTLVEGCHEGKIGTVFKVIVSLKWIDLVICLFYVPIVYFNQGELPKHLERKIVRSISNANY